MSVNTAGLLSGLQTMGQSSGKFEQVMLHEPKSAPSAGGLTLCFWLDKVVPFAEGSGLASVSMAAVVNGRIYVKFLAEPEDAIDSILAGAADDLMSQLCSGFTLGGLVRNVDIFGESFDRGLELDYGYITQDGTVFRVADLVIPLILNDVYVEAP